MRTRTAIAVAAVAILAAVPFTQTHVRTWLHTHHLAPAMTADTLPPALLYRPIILVIDFLDALTKSLTPPNLYLFRTHMAFLHTVELYTAVELRLADAMPESGSGGAPVTSVELARRATQCEGVACDGVASRLTRLLRACATLGVFREVGEAAWVNTVVSDYMRESHPDSMRSAMLMFGRVQFRMMSELPAAIVSGTPSFTLVFGEEFWAWHDKHQDEHRIFDESMLALGRIAGADAAIAQDYPWGKDAEVVVDIGGGLGDMIAQILRYSSNPALKGMIFDLKPVIERARSHWSSPRHARAGVDTSRLTLVAGDVFNASTLPSALQKLQDGVSAGSIASPTCTEDVSGPITYTMRDIVHDWPDEDVVRMLMSIRSVMRDGYTLCYDPSTRGFTRRSASPSRSFADSLVLVDRVVRPGASLVESFGTQDADIVMMGAFNAKERTIAEFEALFARAGLRLVSHTHTRSHYHVITARAA